MKSEISHHECVSRKAQIPESCQSPDAFTMLYHCTFSQNACFIITQPTESDVIKVRNVLGLLMVE